MSNKVYFITGANRGIGFALASALSTDPNNTVIGSARDPTKADQLNALVSQGNVHVVKLDVSSQESIDALEPQLTKYASEGIDYFINNSGISVPEHMQLSLNVGRDLWVEHFTVNTLAPVQITKVLYPFLAKKSTKVIYYVSSPVGSIGGFVEHHSSAYGMSKAALNHYTRLLAWELRDEGFIVVAVNPGFVRTDMVEAFIDESVENDVLDAAMATIITPEVSAEAQIKLIKGLTKEDNSKFLSYTGEEFPW